MCCSTTREDFRLPIACISPDFFLRREKIQSGHDTGPEKTLLCRFLRIPRILGTPEFSAFLKSPYNYSVCQKEPDLHYRFPCPPLCSEEVFSPTVTVRRIRRTGPGALHRITIMVPGQNIFRKYFPVRENPKNFLEKIVTTKKTISYFLFRKFSQKFPKTKKKSRKKSGEKNPGPPYSFHSLIR